MVFGIIPECRSASVRNERSASAESPVLVVLLVLALIFPDPHHQWYTREVLAEKGLGGGLAMWMVVASLYSLPVAYSFELGLRPLERVLFVAKL